MLNVALTGNIAAGKSAVLSLFRAWGATVIDADQLVREAQRPGTEVLQAIAFRFGRDVILPGGELDRAALRGKVVGDEDALAALNAIVHPAVRRERARLLARAEARGDLIVINDIPLLFEAADPADFDLVVLVDAPEDVRRRRLLEIRGLAPVEAELMLRAQQPAGPKRGRSQIVIDNAGSLDALRVEAHRVWRRLRREAATRAAEPGLGAVLVLTAALDAPLPCGTLARYAAAGVSTRVLLATGNPPEAVSWAEALGVAELRLLQRQAEKLADDDAGAVGLVRELLAPAGATAVLLPPRDHPASSILAAWAQRATGEGPTTLLTQRLQNQERATVRLDVRPWADICAGAPGAPPDAAAPTGAECFDDPSRPAGRRFQLLQRA